MTIRPWAHLRGPDFAALDKKRTAVLVTCSPLEVHGPHLPVEADLRESERARYQVRLSENNPDNELETYRVHASHLKSLLQKQLGARDVAETVSELSLKLSYWSVLRDVYEETFEELIRAKGMQAVPTQDDQEQEELL